LAGLSLTWPEFNAWYFKLEPKKEQDYDLLMARIKQAGAPVLSLRRALSPCATDRPVWHARVDRPISMKILDDSPIFH